MKTTTVSFRMDPQETDALEELAKELGLDRSSCLKHLVRRAFLAVRFERACQAYRDRSVSLSRAAEMAGISLREMILKLQEAGLELHYDVQALKDDLEPCSS